MTEWAVFYDDGLIVESRRIDRPENIPKCGVIAIAHMTPEGKRVQRGRDFYWLTDDEDYTWYGGDIFGLWDELTKIGSHVVLFGRSIPDERFRHIVEQAVEYKFDA